MKIAHLVSYSVTYPLKKHNGRYDWVLRLATLQAQAGLKPVIYSSPESYIDRPDIEWRSIESPKANITETNIALMQRAMSDDDIDIYHSHFDFLHYLVANDTKKPIVFTQHWFPDHKVSEAALSVRPQVLAVPVTQYMAAADQELGIPAVAPIYHGIDLELFSLSTQPRSERLLFVGRVAPHKGVAEAVDIALQAGAKLDIIGKLNDKDRAYWETFVDKIDGDQIRYLGPQPQAEVARAMQQAKALIFPGHHIEAFGQTPVEAQACGTPVIAYDLGANRELIADGITGHIVQDTQTFVDRVIELDQIDPQACRKQAERFNIHDMVAQYTALYKQFLG